MFLSPLLRIVDSTFVHSKCTSTKKGPIMAQEPSTLRPSARSPTIYKPILEHQTRLLRLAGDGGDTTSPLSGTLHNVDILHPGIGQGAALYDPPPEGHGRLVEYDALSYTWGTDPQRYTIRCHDMDLSITKNLKEALMMLRRPSESHRWLWIDAVCIDQQDDDDKAKQIPSMFSIYQQAKQVVAWLGNRLDHLDVLLYAMDEEPDGSIASIRSAKPQYSAAAICAAISEVYSHPYFRRIWVQQEVLAASNLVFRCGDREFTWKGVLADPSLLFEHHEFRKWRKRLKSTDGRVIYDRGRWIITPERWQECSWSTSGTGVRACHQYYGASLSFWRPRLYKGPWEVLPRKAPFDEVGNVLATIHQGDTQLRFLKSQLTLPRPVQGPDLIQSLLGTGIQQATNTRDFVYGILPIVGFHISTCRKTPGSARESMRLSSQSTTH